MSEITAVKIQELDRPNRNNRIYPRAVMEEAIAEFNKRPNPMLGTVGMPSDPAVDLTAVSHVVKNLRIMDDYLVADIKVLATPMGAQLEKMLKDDSMVFRSAGFGNVGPDGTISDYRLLCVSAVRAED